MAQKDMPEVNKTFTATGGQLQIKIRAIGNEVLNTKIAVGDNTLYDGQEVLDFQEIFSDSKLLKGKEIEIVTTLRDWNNNTKVGRSIILKDKNTFIEIPLEDELDDCDLDSNISSVCYYDIIAIV